MALFQKAVKTTAKLRMAIAGPSGSGKTYTALAVGTELANGGRVAVVDTEHGSASKYADIFDFDVAEMHAPFAPSKYVAAIQEAAQAGYDVVILDSLSHAWSGTGGVIDIVDEAAKRMKNPNSFAAWKEGTPEHNKLIDAIVQADIHVIGTMRTKTEYVIDERNRPRKVGMAPVQRDQFEYEFDVVLDMDIENNGIVSKTRCSALTGGVFSKPGIDVANILNEWLQGDKPQIDTDTVEFTAPDPQPQQNGAQEDTAPAEEPTDNPFDDVPDLPLHSRVYDQLTGSCLVAVDASRRVHANSDGPASPDQHNYLAALIDEICNQSAHRDVMAVFAGREVTTTNPEGRNLSHKLISALAKTVTDKDAGEKVPNPDYNPDAVACVKHVFDLCLQARGQQKLIDA